MDITELIKDLGFPIAVTCYLLYYMNKQSRWPPQTVNKSIDSMKEVLVDLSGQIAYMISAMISYRNGDKEAGDAMARQSVYLGEELQRKNKKRGASNP